MRYRTGRGVVTALQSISLEIGKNEFLAVVGESGCGKSTLGLAVIGLLQPMVSEIASGSITYNGTNLVALSHEQARYYRGTEIAMVFQEPLSSLNPTYRVERQMAEAIAIRKARKDGIQGRQNVPQAVFRDDRAVGPRFMQGARGLQPEIRSEIVRWLTLVRISDPEYVLRRYPFELSGGMRQRIMIAMALSQEPALLIADEPTTALDVTTQAQVLKLMKELMVKVNASILFISHDLAVASQVAERIVVMYAGEVVEDANVHALFSSPLHPYTQGLLACIPRGTKNSSPVSPIPGSIPDLRARPKGCSFAPRCPFAFDRCKSEVPGLLTPQTDHKVRCFLYDK